ncbi:tetratricopeptide repeat protein [Mesorhizobium sp. CAU 1741]|uniref:tetratricopeptide repeat protein n=1 Tax=Mesorhizobium sp. CAU 1741 TaxID=3140366 RepID=UPI00325B8596
MRRTVLVLIGLLAATPGSAQQLAPDGGRVTAPEIEAIDPDRFGSRPADAAYSAYQRGYYITALNLATPLALDGDPAAQALIGEIYSSGLGVRRDMAKAVEWYGKAAEQDVPEALFQLAMILLDGGAEFRDEERAFSLMERAADAGHRLARFNFAQMLADRDPTERGRERAAEYYEMAAEGGLADAQYAMAQFFRNGTGGKPVDLDKARYWLELAANQNYDTAQIELGTMLVEGRGGAEQEKAGFAWLMRAARAGNPAAQNRVAKLYRSGVGVEADRVTAVAWYLRARRAGLVDQVMEDHIDGLTEEELDLARRRAAIL